MDRDPFYMEAIFIRRAVKKQDVRVLVSTENRRHLWWPSLDIDHLVTYSRSARFDITTQGN